MILLHLWCSLFAVPVVMPLVSRAGLHPIIGARWPGATISEFLLEATWLLAWMASDETVPMVNCSSNHARSSQRAVCAVIFFFIFFYSGYDYDDDLLLLFLCRGMAAADDDALIRNLYPYPALRRRSVLATKRICPSFDT